VSVLEELYSMEIIETDKLKKGKWRVLEELYSMEIPL